MGWATIITMLIELFGPILVEWLKKWLEGRLNRAALRLPAADTYASHDLAREALFDEAIAELRWFNFAKRALLRRMKARGVGPLTDAEVAEFRDLASAAENE